MDKKQTITWQAQDHIKYEKSNDWFWIVGIIAIGMFILSIYFNNILFGLIILLATFVAFLHAKTPPKIVTFEINRKGVRIDDLIYTYSSLESFYLIDEDGYERDRILVKSKKAFVPLIVMPLSPEVDQEEVIDYLLDYLNEEEMEEPVAYKIMQNLGF